MTQFECVLEVDEAHCSMNFQRCRERILQSSHLDRGYAIFSQFIVYHEMHLDVIRASNQIDGCLTPHLFDAREDDLAPARRKAQKPTVSASAESL